MSNTARNHKGNVFCLLYRERGKLLSLYNAMNGMPYREEEKLAVAVININPGNNSEILEKCESLRGYVRFVEKAWGKRMSGIKLEECIAKGVLTDFFTEHKTEIVERKIYEFK